MNRIVGTVCLAVTLLAVGFAVKEGREAAASRVLERLQAGRLEALRARFRSAEREGENAKHPQAALSASAERAEFAPATAPGPAASPAGNFRTWLSSHPAARAQYLKAFRNGINSMWGLLFQSLHLTDAQIEQVTDLLAQREDNDITVAAAALTQGVDKSSPQIQALDDQLDEANKAALKAAVGKEDYAAIHQYLHEQEIIPLVEELAGNVFSTDTPLTADQAMQLTGALADSSEKSESGRVLPNTIQWDQAMTRAQTILSPFQYRAFSAIKDQEETGDQIKQIKRAIIPAGP